MKLRVGFSLLMTMTAVLWAQPARPPTATPGTIAPARPAAAAPAPARPTAGTPTETAPSIPATTGGATSQPITGQQGNDQQQSKIEGFDGIVWGTTYKDVKERFRVMAANANAADNVEIVSDTPDREILIRRREIYYRYVFYKKPADKMVESMVRPGSPQVPKPSDKPATDDPTAGTAKFFFVESIFPLLKAEELYTKLTEKYGQRTGSSVGETNRGAYTWEKEEGFMVQWVEPYATGGYTRSLYYLSRKIRDEIKSDLQAWQFVREIKALENLLK